MGGPAASPWTGVDPVADADGGGQFLAAHEAAADPAATLVKPWPFAGLTAREAGETFTRCARAWCGPARKG